MLNFKFLKWAALCGLLVFALGGCAKDEPCGGDVASDPAPYWRTIYLHYLRKADSFPIVGPERFYPEHYNFTRDHVTLGNVHPFENGFINFLTPMAGTYPLGEQIIVDYSAKGYPAGLCYSAFIRFENAFTDTLEVYKEAYNAGDCDEQTRLAYYVNGEFLTFQSVYGTFDEHHNLYR